MSFDVPTGELAPSRGSVPQGLAGQAHSRDTKPQNGTAEGPKKPIVMHWLKMKENLQIYIISPHALFMASLAHTMRAGQPSTERGRKVRSGQAKPVSGPQLEPGTFKFVEFTT